MSSNADPAKRTLLLVDDSPQIRPLIRAILSDLNCEIVEAETGEEALEKAQAHAGSIDILLTDLNMPGMSGLELASRLRQIYPAAKVLCMSGYTLPAKPVENVEFIEKPFRPATLLKKVQDLS